LPNFWFLAWSTLFQLSLKIPPTRPSAQLERHTGPREAGQKLGLAEVWQSLPLPFIIPWRHRELQNLDGSSGGGGAKFSLVRFGWFEGMSMGLVVNSSDRHVSVCLPTWFCSRNIDRARSVCLQLMADLCLMRCVMLEGFGGVTCDSGLIWNCQPDCVGLFRFVSF
jgi:hypothetical protein